MSGSSARRREDERAARLLAALAAPSRRLDPGEGETGRYELRVAGESAPRIVADAALVEMMLRRDWLRRSGRSLAASEAGLAWLRRRRAGDDCWRGQHLAVETALIQAPGGERSTATVVANESPLAWLRRRRGADGEPLVSETQFAAGERLRADFERGSLGPRVTADWTRAAIGRHRRGPAGGPADLADAALAARRRIEAAVAALGPELGGLLIDVCCFLTRIEDAERRRGWPRRSAKVVLGIALDRLAAHYGLSEAARGRARAGRILHWGDDGYRPRIDGDARGDVASGPAS